MHIRVRNNVVQLIRVTYDKETQKGKNEIIGKLQKNNPTISDDLKKICTKEEIQEIEDWIEGASQLDILASEYAARTLALNIDKATDWLEAQPKDSKIVKAILIDLHMSLNGIRRLMKDQVR
jgi:hypothetical protein